MCLAPYETPPSFFDLVLFINRYLNITYFYSIKLSLDTIYHSIVLLNLINIYLEERQYRIQIANVDHNKIMNSKYPTSLTNLFSSTEIIISPLMEHWEYLSRNK